MNAVIVCLNEVSKFDLIMQQSSQIVCLILKGL